MPKNGLSSTSSTSNVASISGTDEWLTILFGDWNGCTATDGNCWALKRVLDVEQRGGLSDALRRFAGPVRRSGFALLRDARNRLGARDIWVLSAAAYRRVNEQGQSVCVFAEHLREQLGERTLFLEYDSAGFGSPRGDDVLPIDALMLGALAAGEVAGRALGGTLDALTRAASLQRHRATWFETKSMAG